MLDAVTGRLRSRLRNDGFQKYLIARLDEGNQVRVLRYIYSEQLTVPMSGGGASSAEASARWKG